MANQKSPSACARCGEIGHWARQCSSPRAPCNTCGKVGHWARECPAANNAAIDAKMEAMQQQIDQAREMALRTEYEIARKAYEGSDDDSGDGGYFHPYDMWRAYKLGGSVLDAYLKAKTDAESARKRDTYEREIALYERKISDLKTLIQKEFNEMKRLSLFNCHVSLQEGRRAGPHERGNCVRPRRRRD